MSNVMDNSEIKALCDELYEGTLMLVEGDKPYGVVVWYCFDGNDIWVGLLPKGRKFECMKKNPNAAFSVFKSSNRGWCSVLVEGRIEQVKDREGIKSGMKLSSQKYNMPQEVLDSQVERFAKDPEKSMVFRLRGTSISGRKSY